MAVRSPTEEVDEVNQHNQKVNYFCVNVTDGFIMRFTKVDIRIS